METNSYRQDFVKCLDRMAGRYSRMDVFADVCGMMAAALEKPMSLVSEECEKRYMTLASKYNTAEMNVMAEMLAIVVKALEAKRESFLGPILEIIGAAAKNHGQVLTPASVASLCARVVNGDNEDHRDGELITVADPACGAGVLLIAEGEELIKSGVPQRDIFLVGGDIDQRACDITFIELNLLGYAARIDHMDALSGEMLSRSRWTTGYYLHGTQWRERKNKREGAIEGSVGTHEITKAEETPNQLKQGEFAL